MGIEHAVQQLERRRAVRKKDSKLRQLRVAEERESNRALEQHRRDRGIAAAEKGR